MAKRKGNRRFESEINNHLTGSGPCPGCQQLRCSAPCPCERCRPHASYSWFLPTITDEAFARVIDRHAVLTALPQRALGDLSAEELWDSVGSRAEVLALAERFRHMCYARWALSIVDDVTAAA